MKFFGYFRSSAAYRCRIAFNLKGIAPEAVSVHLRKGEHKEETFRSINPQALLPALAIDGEVLTQSLAILEWLEETYPDPPILAEDELLRAKIRAFAQVIACDIHPLQNLRVLDYLRETYGQRPDSVERWCQRWIGDGLLACEQVLESQSHASDFCFGDRPSLADICLIPQLFNAARFKVDLSSMPRIRAIADHCAKLPAFVDAHPSRQPDAE